MLEFGRAQMGTEMEAIIKVDLVDLIQPGWWILFLMSLPWSSFGSGHRLIRVIASQKYFIGISFKHTHIIHFFSTAKYTSLKNKTKQNTHITQARISL